MKTFVNQMLGIAMSDLRALSTLLILLYTSLQLNAQSVTAKPAESKISVFLTTDNRLPIAFGLIDPISIITVPGGRHLAPIFPFRFFTEIPSNVFFITNEMNRMNLPDLKMLRDVSTVKYWQESWYQPFINTNTKESNQKDTSRKYVPKKYWQIDWFNNVP